MAFQRQMHELMEHYDVIIMDTPAGELTADAQTISTVTRGAFLVTRKNSTKVKAARQLAGQLSDCGAEAVGAIINDF